MQGVTRQWDIVTQIFQDRKGGDKQEGKEKNQRLKSTFLNSVRTRGIHLR